MGKSEAVKVVVRCRPLNSTEKSKGMKAFVDMDERLGRVSVRNPKGAPNEPPKTFTFDAVYGPNCLQTDIYNQSARPIVEAALEGFNGTVFAYGQTGTGKTHTMEGVPADETLKGVIPRAFDHIFETIGLDQAKNTEFLVRASYLEIYQEEVRDLLSKNPKNRLDLRETKEKGVYVEGLSSFVVKGQAEIMQVMSVGKKNRSVGETKMNRESSRSHSIFTITVEASEMREGDEEAHIRVGTLNLVDLAGSERQTKTEAAGERLKEGCKINLSLSALGNVISALVDGKSKHIPYRDSKLTRLLQDSLGGNSKTVMIANVGPADYNYEETMSTLRYANRAKSIKNKPKINEDPKDAMLREFQEEIQRLRAQLAAAGGGGEIPVQYDQSGQPIVQHVTSIEGVPEHVLQELEAKTKEERAALLEQKEMAEEQKQKIQEELEKRDNLLNAESKQREVLERKLKAMSEKLIVGGVSILDRAAQQEAELRRQEIEIEQRRLEEERIRAQLEEKQSMMAEAEERYTSLQDEVDKKTKKLKKLWTQLQASNQDLEDLQTEFQSEREDLLDTVRELTHQLKLKELIIDNFIPPEEVKKVEMRANWDEEHDDWTIDRIQLAGNNLERPSTQPGRRPASQYARVAMAMGDPNPRFKANNILNMDLEMPDRTTVDYDGPAVAPRVQAALNAALAEEDDMTFQASENLPNVYFAYDPEAYDEQQQQQMMQSTQRSSSSKKKSRPQSAKRSKKKRDVPTGWGEPADAGGDYPEARGLVRY